MDVRLDWMGYNETQCQSCAFTAAGDKRYVGAFPIGAHCQMHQFQYAHSFKISELDLCTIKVFTAVHLCYQRQFPIGSGHRSTKNEVVLLFTRVKVSHSIHDDEDEED